MMRFLVPGLAGFASQREGVAAPVPECPALNRILTRSKAEADDSLSMEENLLSAFGVATAPGAEPPVAALARLADLPDATGNHWLRADPAYLRADRDHLRFFDAHILDLDMAEARTLAAEINNVYREDGWQLYVAAPDRWYLSLPEPAQITTFSPMAAVGRVMDPFLPGGSDATRWHGVMTEMQMLMHMSDVNQKREARGQFPVNSIWFWGGGAVPGVKPLPQAIYSDEPLSRGLALAAGQQARALPRNFYELDNKTDRLLVLDGLRRPSVYNDADAWRSQIESYERDWFEPALSALQAGTLDGLEILPVNGKRHVLKRSGLRRFWRRGNFWQGSDPGG